MNAFRAKPPKGGRLNRGDSLAKSLKLAWLFNDGAGLRVSDAVSAAHGTISNIASPYTASSGWTSGGYGKCLALDGTDDQCASAANPFGTNPTDNWTLGCVVTPRSTVGEQAYFGHTFDTEAGGSSGYVFELESGVFKVLFSGIIRSPLPSPGPLSAVAGRTYAVIVTRISGTLNVYINGVSYLGLTTTAPTAPSTSATVAAGFQTGGAGRYAAANIECGFVWHRGFTATDAALWMADPFRMFRPRVLLKTAAVAGSLLLKRRRMAAGAA